MHDTTPDSWSSRPPRLTGGHRNQNLPYFAGIDYLRLTVFGPVDMVLSRLDDWLDRWAPALCGTAEVSPMYGRLKAVYRFPGQRGLEVEEAEEYSGVLLKGEPCQALGLDAVLDLLTYFDAARWHCTRIDFAWDGFPLSTRQVFDLLKAGHVRTKADLDPYPMGDLDADPIDGKGSTVYTHQTPEKRGIDRYVRWYDMRGPVRCELRLGGKYAKSVCARLYEATTETAGMIGMSALRGLLDLTDPAQHEERPTRRDLHPAWSAFVDGVEPWRMSTNAARAEREGLEFIGTIETSIMRAARRLFEASQAFGDEWLLERIRHYGQPKASLTAIEKLKGVRAAAAHNRIANVPAWPAEYDAEVPI